jgi:hypothetical protein
MKSKRDWTQELFQHYQSDIDAVPSKDLYVLLWYNTSINRGFRLSTMGFEIIKNMGYDIYTHKLDVKTHPITSKCLVTMDRVVDTPWYLDRHNHISFTDSKISSMLLFCQGNLQQAIDTLG